MSMEAGKILCHYLVDTLLYCIQKYVQKEIKQESKLHGVYQEMPLLMKI